MMVCVRRAGAPLIAVWLTATAPALPEPVLPGLDPLDLLADSLSTISPEQERFTVQMEQLDVDEEILSYGEPWNLEFILEPEFELGHRDEDRPRTQKRGDLELGDELTEGEVALGFEFQKDFFRPEAVSRAESDALDRDRLAIRADWTKWAQQRLDELVSAWFAVRSAERLIPVLEEELRRRQTWVETLIRHVEQGRSLPIHVEEARLDANDLAQDLERLRRDRDRALAAAQTFLNDGAALPGLPQSENVADPAQLSADRLWWECMARHPERRALEEIAAFRTPDENLFADYAPRLRLTFETAATFGERNFYYETRRDETVRFGGGVGVQIPLAGNARKKAIRRKNELKMQEDRTNLRVWDAEQRMAVDRALAALQDAWNTREHLQRKLEIARERARITRLSIESEAGAGRKTVLDLEKDLQAVFEEKKAKLIADNELIRRYCQLGMLVGVPVGRAG